MKRKNKKKSKIVNWNKVKVGDFVESKDTKLFCYSVIDNCPTCLGMEKTKQERKRKEKHYAVVFASGKFVRMKPDKKFLKLCKFLLEYTLEKGYVDNLSYIEALSALKSYGV